MKALAVTITVIMLFGLKAQAESPPPGNFQEVKIVAESKNASGEILLIRELVLLRGRGTPENAAGNKYYRFEFWSHNVMRHSETRLKDGDGDKVSMKWYSDSACIIHFDPRCSQSHILQG